MTELVPFQLETSEELELLELVSSEELLPLELVSSLPDSELELDDEELAEGQVDNAETASDGRKGSISVMSTRQSGHTRPC